MNFSHSTRDLTDRLIEFQTIAMRLCGERPNFDRSPYGCEANAVNSPFGWGAKTIRSFDQFKKVSQRGQTHRKKNSLTVRQTLRSSHTYSGPQTICPSQTVWYQTFWVGQTVCKQSSDIPAPPPNSLHWSSPWSNFTQQSRTAKTVSQPNCVNGLTVSQPNCRQAELSASRTVSRPNCQPAKLSDSRTVSQTVSQALASSPRHSCPTGRFEAAE